MIKLRGYIFSRPFLEERVPQHVQNIIIRDYCSKNNFHYLLSATEYAMPHSDVMLKHILEQLDEIDGIIVATISPDYMTPSVACLLQERLNARKIFAFDVSAGCSGFIYCLKIGLAPIILMEGFLAPPIFLAS